LSDALRAWCDGLVEPIQPGGIGTYGFVIKARDTLLHSECGMAGTPFKVEMTNNVAEYEGLIHCLQWLATHAPERSCVIHSDSKLIVSQVLGKWRVNSDHLRPYWRRARTLLDGLPKVEIRHIPRELNHEADEQTHRCYEAYMDAHPEIHELLPFATPNMLAALKEHGIPTYRYMGRIDAMRLLRKRQPERAGPAGGSGASGP
jgi:ribonuclease HI